MTAAFLEREPRSSVCQGLRAGAWDRRMFQRLRDVLKLDAVVPVVLIAAALLMTLEPTILGVTITERHDGQKVTRTERKCD